MTINTSNRRTFMALRFGMLHIRSVSPEHLLYLRRLGLLHQCQHEQNSCLLRIQLVGSNETHLVIVYFDITIDKAGSDTAAAYYHDTFLGSLGGGIDCALVHVAVAYAGNDNALRSGIYTCVDEVRGHINVAKKDIHTRQ